MKMLTAIALFTTSAWAYEGTATFYEGIGGPISACGVPTTKLGDLPFVALNENTEYNGGKNCGRWVEITLGNNCAGGSNSATSVCNGGSYAPDEHTGKKVYGYVTDKCPDNNYWCQSDSYHLDIRKNILDGAGMTAGWNGRKISWDYMEGNPSGVATTEGPKFMFKDGSKWLSGGKGFYSSLVVYDIDNGIGGVQQKVGNEWKPLANLNDLGQQFIMEQPAEYRGFSSREFQIRVDDVNGKPYGTYNVQFPCEEICGAYTDATATPVAT